MFEQLTDKLGSVFKKLTGRGLLTEQNIKDAAREIRMALLEADVNYKIVRQFIADVESRALGQEVIKSIQPGQVFVKIVHDEMTKLLGGGHSPLTIAQTPPTIVMLVGLHGSGKTTLAGKLARHFRQKGRYPLLVAADIYRPAAKKQLEILAKSIDIPFFTSDNTAVDICLEAVKFAYSKLCDFVILDTAGRLQVDETLMNELADIKTRVKPTEVIFVADSMTGQEAVNVAAKFNEKVGLTGVVLTKLDGDARGGAALSIKAALQVPIKFVGVGEKLDALEEFHPERMASRILGMGDIVSLVEKAQQAVDLEKARKLEQKLRKAEFTFEDFLDQLKQVRNMGPLESLLEMIPGLGGQLKGMKIDERAMSRIEAIINSMTLEERRNPSVIDGSRRKRIARGSGTSVQDVNALMKQFTQMQKMLKQFSRAGARSFLKGFPI